MCHSQRDARRPAGAEWAAERGSCARFPWWALWMIWPLLALAKWLAPLYLGAATTLATTLQTFRTPLLVVLAAALIVAGLALIRPERA